MHKLYFTRHGETVWNVENKICGMTDSPLTERGRAQARALGQKVKAGGYAIDEILYSPLSRAADTAKAIADATGKVRQRGEMRAGFFGDHGMGRRRPDVQPAIADADALHLGDPGQADQHRRRGQPLLHCRQQGLPARQRLRPIRRQGLGRICNRRRLYQFKVIHRLAPLPVDRRPDPRP